jgi:hypothetical protein
MGVGEGQWVGAEHRYPPDFIKASEQGWRVCAHPEVTPPLLRPCISQVPLTTPKAFLTYPQTQAKSLSSGGGRGCPAGLGEGKIHRVSLSRWRLLGHLGSPDPSLQLRADLPFWSQSYEGTRCLRPHWRALHHFCFLLPKGNMKKGQPGKGQ